MVVRHRIKTGHTDEFEKWLRGITHDMAAFAGHQGHNVVRSGDAQRPEYLIFLRFDNFANLSRWEESPVRQQWLERLDALAAEPAYRERHSGLEVWFTPPAGHTPPPRWKMLLVTLMAIYPLITFVQYFLGPHMAAWPLPLRTLVSSSLLVCIMIYLAMPLMTRTFARWLYGQ